MKRVFAFPMPSPARREMRELGLARRTFIGPFLLVAIGVADGLVTAFSLAAI